MTSFKNIVQHKANTKKLVVALAGGALASLVAFLSTPISIELLGELKFAQLSLWIILVTFVQILDFGFCQHTTRICTKVSGPTEKQEILKENNSIILYLIVALAVLSMLIPKPSSSTYATITEGQWLIFKISIVLNLKLIYNQAALIIQNKQTDYTVFQNLIVLSRYIIPIIVYLLSGSFNYVNAYFVISSLVLILITDARLGLRLSDSFDLASALRLVRWQLKPALHVYTSGAAAIVLGVMDRIIASYLLGVGEFAKYVATFTLASAVNIVVLPFYRFFIGGMRASGRRYNQKNALRISAIQSYACLLAIGCICLYGIPAIQALGLSFPVDQMVLAVIALSLWGAANGWIISAEIMLHNQPTLQARLIGLTILAYLGYLLLTQNPQPLDLAMIWAIHGVVQTFVSPLWMDEKFRLSRYILWVRYVVLLPSLAVGSLIAASYLVAITNILLSLALFLLGALILVVLVVKGSALEKLA